MAFPKMIHDFMLHDVLGDWKYRGKELVSAHYLKVGSRMSLYIRTIADVSGEHKFEIQLRDSYIGGIPTLGNHHYAAPRGVRFPHHRSLGKRRDAVFIRADRRGDIGGASEEFGARTHRSILDGHTRYGHRGGAHRLSPISD